MTVATTSQVSKQNTYYHGKNVVTIWNWRGTGQQLKGEQDNSSNGSNRANTEGWR